MIVRARDLRFSYGEGFTLHVADWGVPAGAAVAIVGPSGCGKTTLLDLLAGVRVGSGELSVLDTAIGTLSEAGRRRFRRSRLGFVFQRFELLDYLTVRQNIALAADLAGRGHDRVDGLADAMGIAHTLGRKPDALSHGERQRVAICRALVHQPALVLADEPTGSLDPARAQAVVALLREQCAANQATLIMVTHDPSLLDGFQVVDAGEFAA